MPRKTGRAILGMIDYRNCVRPIIAKSYDPVLGSGRQKLNIAALQISKESQAWRKEVFAPFHFDETCEGHIVAYPSRRVVPLLW